MCALSVDKFQAAKLLAISFLFLSTFGLTSLEKWRGGGVPEWFKSQFEKTFIARLPGGLKLAYFQIAVLETLVALLVLASLARLEFLGCAATVSGVSSDKAVPVFLLGALHLALFVFAMLGFGLRLAGDYVGTANLFFYFGATLVAIQAVL